MTTQEYFDTIEKDNARLHEENQKLKEELKEARRLAEAYREVWELCSRAVDQCPNDDPLPWESNK